MIGILLTQAVKGILQNNAIQIGIEDAVLFPPSQKLGLFSDWLKIFFEIP